MAEPKLLQSDYSRGSISDLARHLIPRSSVWRMTDYIPNLDGAPLAKRGGWTDASPALGGTGAMQGVAYAPFSAGSQLIGIDVGAHLWKIDSPSSATDKGAAAYPIQRPVFFNNLLIIPGISGSNIQKYNGSAAPSNLGGTPPQAQYAIAYKGRLYIGGSAGNPNRIWPSDILNPELWNTTTGYMDMTNPIRGMAALRNAILVWSDGGTERIRGDVPPPGGDMVREPIFEEGCVDARSIVVHGDKAIWANSNGVHISDGAAIANLIQLGGQQQLWSDLFASYTSSWSVAGGTLRGYYVIVIFDNSTSTLKLAAMCDVDNKSWIFLDNVPANMFAEAYGAKGELYFSQRTRARVGAFSPIFVPTSANMSDGDGKWVEPIVETQYFRGSPGSRRWKDIFIGNDISTVSGAGTFLRAGYITASEDEAYSPIMREGTRQLVPNGGFDRGVIEPWVLSSSLASIAIDGPVAMPPPYGAYRLWANTSSTSGTAAALNSEYIPIDQEQTYTLSGEFFGTATGVQATLRVQCFDSKLNSLGFVYPNVAVPGVPYVAGHFNLSATGVFEIHGGAFQGHAGINGTASGGFMNGTKFVKVEAYLFYLPAGAVTVYLDNVALTPGLGLINYADYVNDDSYKIQALGGYDRTKLPLRIANDGFALKIEQVGPSAQTLLYDIEATVLEREASRR